MSNIIEVVTLNHKLYKAETLLRFRPKGAAEFMELTAQEIRNLLDKEAINEKPEDNH